MTRPKPITDPHTGHYQVVVSFRVGRMRTPMDRWLRELRGEIRRWAEEHSSGIAVGTLDVAVREIGAGGETVEMEGEGP